MVELLWGSGELVIRNPTPTILQALHYNRRHFVKEEDMAQKEIQEEKTQLYRETEAGTITTFQGFIDLVVQTCEEYGTPYQVADMRSKLPAPQILNTGGFRFGQKKMFFEMLAKQRSGIFKAPTRYGKTIVIANVCRAFPGIQTVVTAPRTDLVSQLHAQLKELLPDRELKGIYQGSKGKKVSDDITVVSMDSLHKADPENCKLLLVDEPHACVSPTRIVEMMKFRHARVYGFGATVEGRFDGGDKLITAAIGPVLTDKTFKEAVHEGAICPIVVYMLKVKFSPFAVFNRDQAYRKLVFRSRVFNDIVRKISSEVIPPFWQTLIFIDEIKQADLMQLLLVDGVIAVASRMDKNERKQRYDDLVNDLIKRCICTDIYATGITFPDLRVVINAAGGGGSITATQKPGRLAQCRPGKKCGYLIDFLFQSDQEQNFGKMNHWRDVQNDCYSRMANYKKLGFDVKIVTDVKDMEMT